MPWRLRRITLGDLFDAALQVREAQVYLGAFVLGHFAFITFANHLRPGQINYIEFAFD